MKRIDIDDADEMLEDLLYHLARYKFILRHLKPEWNVLEVGCGTGYGARFLSKYVNYYNATELDKEVFNQAKSRFEGGKLEFTEHPTKNAYDCVVNLEVIEHMTKTEAYDLLKHIKSCLKPNGIAFISTPRKIENPSENRKKWHIHEYEYQEFKEILETEFSHALIFSQNDEIISSQNPGCAWNFMAICFNGQ